jgi:hypothetical protein
MHDHTIDPEDEGRHEFGSEPFWNESYYFDFHREDGSLGGYVRIGLHPNMGVTWYWATLVGEGRPLVTLIDHHAPLPEPGSLDLQHGDMKAYHRCEVPTRRFALGVEGTAQAFQDPAQIYETLQGEPTPLKFDLEWETDGPGGYRFRDMDRYEISCHVKGRIRVGAEEIDFKGHGQRDHSWGNRDWWTTVWCWNAGWFPDGTRFHSVEPRTLDGENMPWAAGYVQPPGKPLEPIHSSFVEEELGPAGLPRVGRIEVGDLHLEVEPQYFAPVPMVAPDGRVSHFARCLARFRDEADRQGYGWIEWNQPQQS